MKKVEQYLAHLEKTHNIHIKGYGTCLSGIEIHYTKGDDTYMCFLGRSTNQFGYQLPHKHTLEAKSYKFPR